MIEFLIALLTLAVACVGYLLEKRMSAIETSLASLWKHVRQYLPSTP